MKNKLIIVGLIIILLITCSESVFADDLNNMTFVASDSQVISIDEVSDEISTSEITITDDNYDNYFDKYTGKLKDDVDKNLNTIKIGNVSNKAFTIDRPLNLLSVSSDCEISNGVIHLVAGSSGSNITNLIINNTKGELYHDGLFVSKLHGIWLSNSSDNIISNNTIRIPGAEGSYAMPMSYSSRNKILYNDIESTFTSCILMGLCDYNNISNNKIKIKTTKDLVASNLIYFNCFGHADYSGPANCVGTYISNNYLENANSDNIWAYTLNVLGESNDTVIVNNTIVKGYIGIKVFDEWGDGTQAKNILIKDNTVINASNIIVVSTRDVTVSNNKIIGSSSTIGISINGGKNKDNISVFENEIEYENLYQAIGVFAEANVHDNIIKLSNYGIGIAISADKSNIDNNKIYVTSDAGISIAANDVQIVNNIIHTKSIGVISTVDKDIFKKANNSICDNKIYSESYAVLVKGYVYNTTINNNFVETNQSNPFLIDIIVTLEDSNLGNISENTVNGVIENTEILVINDTNFYDYFDDEGYLKYNFKNNSKKILFITFLSNKNLYFTDSITLTSNKQANLLYNVTITLNGDASNSTIKDFKFYSFDKESIVLEGVENVIIKDNEFTISTNDIFEIKAISVIKGCNLCEITNNKIFMNSNANYTYAICISEPQYLILKKISSNFTISNNNILIKSSNVAEAMYFDALIESNITNNNINIISDGSAYGIAVCNVFNRLHDVNVDSNKIVVNSKDMSYLIELYKVDNCPVLNNYLKATSNGLYSIGLYDSISKINGNEIIVIGKNLLTNSPDDALGKGNSVIYLTRGSQVEEFKNNIIDTQNCEIITKLDSNINKLISNSFVISNYNYKIYFNPNAKLKGEIIKDGDKILFKNFTDSKIMEIDVSIEIKPYNHLNEFKGNLILVDGSNKSKISGFNFNNAIINFNNVSDILITLNNFTNSKLKDNNGNNNRIINNIFNPNSTKILIDNCLNDVFELNNISIDSNGHEFILINNSNQTSIFNNSFDVKGNSIKVIESNLSDSTLILNNIFNINASGDVYGYKANNVINDRIINNFIFINVDGMPVAIYYSNSSQNKIEYNRIISNSHNGQDYAIIIESQKNSVTNNYLIASNGFKKGNDAVNATGNNVHDNLPVNIYVSVNGSEEGDGTFENPYPTIKKAIENCLSGSIIHILPGMYNESSIVIDKNVTLTAINTEGNTYINALNKQLFTIKSNGTLTVNALKIFNGFSVEGGSIFNNLGLLLINNSVIYNSSSYYDNSNPTFKISNKFTPYLYYSYDCRNLGVGGAILNKGNLIIISSTLYDNFAHKGGAIADFGKTTIKNSLFYNNTGVHGGAIYTNSANEFIIENSVFSDNLAIQTIDYCAIQRISSDSSFTVVRYHYSSRCEMLPGMGGAIFSNTPLNIDNSLFKHNQAKIGGAIAYDSNILTNQNYFHDYLDYDGKGPVIVYSQTSNLNINNSIFKDNEATNTSCGNLTMLVDKDSGSKIYNIHFEGGAIFGALRQFNVYNTTFIHNIANSDGGALCVQSLNSSIEASKFYDNVAGGSAGAIDAFGNFEVFNTEIINNSAKNGGALQYSAYTIYERIQNNMGIFNVTVSGNKALNKAGAFLIGNVNFSIRNSNIYDNFAPEGATFSGLYGVSTRSNIDARGNWWGSTDGPDDSVWAQRNIKFRIWSGQKVDWKNALIHANNNIGDGNKEGNGGNPSVNPTVSTGSGVHTGSTLTDDSYSPNSGDIGLNFNGNWPSRNNGNNGGNGIDDGVNPFISLGDSKTNARGNTVNPNSLSKTNSSSVNNLASVGMTSNAADSSTSSQSSSSEDGSGESGKAYEITKEVKKELIDDDLSIFNILFILLWIFFFIGFYRKYRIENN